VLADSAWITPLAQDEILLWQEALANVEITDNSSSTPERQTRAELKDVSLELPDDVNTELLDGLLQELPVQVAAFTGAIARIAADREVLRMKNGQCEPPIRLKARPIPWVFRVLRISPTIWKTFWLH